METKKEIVKKLDTSEATIKKILTLCKGCDSTSENMAKTLGIIESVAEIYFQAN